MDEFTVLKCVTLLPDAPPRTLRHALSYQVYNSCRFNSQILDCMTIASRVFNILRSIRQLGRSEHNTEATAQLLLAGRMMAQAIKSKSHIQTLSDTEFRVFSQFGDDGIIQWLTANLEIPNKTFIEFGVEDYHESNTRFLMMNDNWSGLVIDGSDENVAKIVASDYFWKFELTAKSAFIDCDNINSLLSTPRMEAEIGILSIDLDGNDYWVLQRINVVTPVILIVEYNAVLGKERTLTVPYDPKFRRTAAHHSNLYWGASLAAFHLLCEERGYAFVGCNSSGVNAYFVRREKLNDRVREVALQTGFVMSKFRESRSQYGQLTHISGDQRLLQIRGLPVMNTSTGQLEAL